MDKMFNGNGATVTEKLGLDSEVRELKFGSSFNPGNKGQQGFHTIKYDFKPASVDKSKTASLEVGPSGQVTISMPHYDNSGSTHFKGSTRPSAKECVLIIDKTTGQFVLEKLSHNVQVKKTRQEGSVKSSSKNQGNLPQQPIETDNGRSSVEDFKIKKEREEVASKKSSHSLNPMNAGSGISKRSNSPFPPPSRHSPMPAAYSPSPASYENVKQATPSAAAFDTLITNKSSIPQMPSLGGIEDLFTSQPAPLTSAEITPKIPSTVSSDAIHSSKIVSKKAAGELSDSSSDSSSSSSSDEDDDSSSASDIEMEDVPIPPSLGLEPILRMPEQALPPPRNKQSTPHHVKPIVMPSMAGSMPSLDMDMPSHLLSEDLQLSESGSDSD